MKYLISVMCLLFCSFAFGAALTVQQVSETPAAITYANANSGGTDTCANKDGKVFVHFKNTGESSASAIISAIATSRTVPGYGPLTKANLTVTLTAAQDKVVGPLTTGAWVNSSGNIVITYSGAGAADVSVACLRLSNY